MWYYFLFISMKFPSLRLLVSTSLQHFRPSHECSCNGRLRPITYRGLSWWTCWRLSVGSRGWWTLGQHTSDRKHFCHVNSLLWYAELTLEVKEPKLIFCSISNSISVSCWVVTCGWVWQKRPVRRTHGTSMVDFLAWFQSPSDSLFPFCWKLTD